MSARPVRADSREAPPRRSAASLAAFALFFALGATVVVLGTPRTIAAWESLAARPAMSEFEDNKYVDDAKLAAGIAGLRRAVSWIPLSRYLTQLATLQLVQSVRLGQQPEERAKVLEDAEANFIRSLRASPPDGFAWLRLAVVRQLRQAPKRDVVIALVQSLDMTPSMRQLWIPRAEMFFQYWQLLTPEEVEAVRSQLRAIWTAVPGAHEDYRLPLVRGAWLAGRLPELSSALGDDPETQAQLEAVKESLLRPPKR
jgi:hypothetical protein